MCQGSELLKGSLRQQCRQDKEEKHGRRKEKKKSFLSCFNVPVGYEETGAVFARSIANFVSVTSVWLGIQEEQAE